MVSISATRLGQVSGSSGLPGRDMFHEIERQHNEPDPVTSAHNAGEAAQTSSGAELGTSLEAGSGADDRLHAP